MTHGVTKFSHSAFAVMNAMHVNADGFANACFRRRPCFRTKGARSRTSLPHTPEKVRF